MKNLKTIDFDLDLKKLEKGEFEGHGSVFGNVDHGGDVVLPSAFKRTLKEHEKAGTLPQMFWMHRMDQVPGKWLEMSEDKKGLYVKGVLADTDLGRDMHTLLKMKAVRGLSIGYQTREADYDKDGNRLLKDVDLWEVSIVSLAMNPLAQAEMVKSRLSSTGEYVPTPRDFERILLDAKCSRRVAKTCVAKLYDGSDLDSGMLDDGHLRDADPADVDAVLKAVNDLTGKLVASAISSKLR